ncbi:MAG: hypothetical protein R6X02_15990 [Enhygromyxa sp.]
MAAVALTLSGFVSACSFEEVRCELSFETDASPLGVTNTWITQDCAVQVYGDNLTMLQIGHDDQSVELDIYGSLSADSNEIELEYWDGSRRWTHGGGDGVGPACVVVFDSARMEPWTRSDRLRASGTISCPGKLTANNPNTFEKDELALRNASFEVFASDDTFKF